MFISGIEIEEQLNQLNKTIDPITTAI